MAVVGGLLRHAAIVSTLAAVRRVSMCAALTPLIDRTWQIFNHEEVNKIKEIQAIVNETESIKLKQLTHLAATLEGVMLWRSLYMLVSAGRLMWRTSQWASMLLTSCSRRRA